MPDGFEFDFTDLTKLADQLGDVKKELNRGRGGTRLAVESAAFVVKEGWQKSLEGSSVPASASTVEYEATGSGESASALIQSSHGSSRLRGYVAAREYGSPTVAPHLDAQNATPAGEADLQRGMGIAGERAINRALGNL